MKSVGAVVMSNVSPWSAMSSAPASRAASISSSSSTPDVLSTMIIPVRWNCQATAPGSAREPPLRVKTFFTSDVVRLRLSVRHSTITATPLEA